VLFNLLAKTNVVLIDSGADPVGGTPEEHEAFNRSEIARWHKVIEDAGIAPE